VSRSVAIVGGGLLGLTSAYRLLQAGVDVAVYERSTDLGGLVGSFDFAGHPVDRFYHVVLPTDHRVLGLARELGLEGGFRFRPTRTGFYDDGRLFSMSSLREFATFPLLPPHDRVRLAAFVAGCQLTGSPEALDDVPLLEWLRRRCGRRAVERLWVPLLDSKFDGRYDDLPATYIWARTRRMSRTRDGAGGEVMGWLAGGYQRLIDALAARIEELGGELHPGTSVEQITGDHSRATGVVVGGRQRSFDVVVSTLVPPQMQALLAPSFGPEARVDHCRYLGVVCVLVRATRSVSPYYTLNITDRRIPLTTVVETTHVVDPAHVGGTLLYVTRYVDPGHADLSRPSAEVEADYIAHARTMLPGLREDVIADVTVQRARIVEPVHVLDAGARIPKLAPLPGLVLASTAHVYPEIVNGQSVLGVAERVVDSVLEHVPDRVPLAA
jgi:protoporphyrinogen oxidase